MSSTAREVTAPAWTSYAGEARRMIAAVRAMGLLELGLLELGRVALRPYGDSIIAR